MIPHLSIGPAGGTRAALASMLERVKASPGAFHVEEPGKRHTLVFCDSREAADQQRRQLAGGGLLSASCCTVEIDDFGLRANQEGTPAARAALQDFLRWLLATHAPCRVWDEGSGTEIRDTTAIFG